MEKICIIGAGYVGLVSGAGLSEFGNEVTCVDLDEEKIKQLNNGEISIYEPGLKSLVQTNFNKKKLYFTNDISKAIQDSKIIFIAVGTPQKKNGGAVLSYVRPVRGLDFEELAWIVASIAVIADEYDDFLIEKFNL